MGPQIQFNSSVGDRVWSKNSDLYFRYDYWYEFYYTRGSNILAVDYKNVLQR
jgi:hypothetical protein